MKKVLLLVPHEDDELLIGGGLLVCLARDKKYDVSVVIATNGDYYPYEHPYRIQESVTAMNKMGINNDHIFFLGYGDDWHGKHIYNSNPDEIKESAAGHTETYLTANLKEWHYQRHQRHQVYTRKGYLDDIKDVIVTMSPDIIICVDMDPHQDHRCLSLLTDEALAEILKSDHSFRPVFLKKYAYKDMLLGVQDFFVYPHRRTVDRTKGIWNPYLHWNDRISYKTPGDCSTVFLHNSLLYKVSRIYRTQDIWTKAAAFINDDITYWQRNVNNEMLGASITASSGAAEFINDFKLVSSADIQKEDIDYSQECWRPDQSDQIRTIKATFPAPVGIRTMNIYFNCQGGLEGNYSVLIRCKDGNTMMIDRSLSTKDDFFIEKIDLNVSETYQIEFCFKDLCGKVGIGEIEALNYKQPVPFAEYLYDSREKNKNILTWLIRMLLLAERGIFKIEKALYFRVDPWRRRKAEFDKDRQIS